MGILTTRQYGKKVQNIRVQNSEPSFSELFNNLSAKLGPIKDHLCALSNPSSSLFVEIFTPFSQFLPQR